MSLVVVHRFGAQLVIVPNHVLGIAAQYDLTGLVLPRITEAVGLDRDEKFEARIEGAETNVRFLQFLRGAGRRSRLPSAAIWVGQHARKFAGRSELVRDQNGQLVRK